jgi:hypothetical protein
MRKGPRGLGSQKTKSYYGRNKPMHKGKPCGFMKKGYKPNPTQKAPVKKNMPKKNKKSNLKKYGG